jgi:rhodanese-related sulfurtransferase
MKRLFLVLLLLPLLLAPPLFAGSVPKIDIDELKSKLGADDLVILDVRAGRDWSTSEFKIQGAVRVDGKDLATVEKYPKESTFVLYCA